MTKEVSIVFGEDGRVWMEYLQDQIKDPETVNAQTFIHEDKMLFTRNMDSRTETRILKASAVLVIVTPCHMDYLVSTEQATYERLVPNGHNGIMLLVGISEQQINEKDVRGATRKKFPNYDNWVKVVYEDANSIKELLDQVVEVMERPETLQSQFTVNPTDLRCEEDNNMVVMIDEAIPENSKVHAVIRGTFIDCSFLCSKVNPYTYKFVMPKCEEGEATVYMDVDGHSLGCQVKVYYRSSIASSDMTAVNEIYCHLLDSVCKLVITKNKMNLTTEDVDNTLSEIFDHTVDLPAVGYEKLFGIYQYYTEEKSRTGVPTLVHLAAKHDLKEVMARIQDLPNFLKVLSITNRHELRPKEMAEQAGFKDLAEFIDELEESLDLYSIMMYGEKVDYKNRKDYLNIFGNQKPHTIDDYSPMSLNPDSQYTDMVNAPHLEVIRNQPAAPEEDYMDMEAPEKHRSDSDSSSNYSIPETPSPEKVSDVFHNKPNVHHNLTTQPNIKANDLVHIQERFKNGELSMEDVEREFFTWQKKQPGNSSNSFKAKQAQLKIAKQELNKAKVINEDHKPKSKWNFPSFRIPGVTGTKKTKVKVEPK